MHEAVEDGVGERRVADDVVPFLDGELAGDDGLPDAVSVLEDFEQVVPVLGAERGEPPVVEHEDLGLGDAPRDAGQQGMLFDREIYDDLDRLDDLIDDNRLRGEPPVLRELAGNLRAEPGTRRELDRLARDCQTAGLRDRLTPELHALLFPHKGRKQRR